MFTAEPMNDLVRIESEGAETYLNLNYVVLVQFQKEKEKKRLRAIVTTVSGGREPHVFALEDDAARELRRELRRRSITARDEDE